VPQLDGSFIMNAFENVDVRFKDDKAFLLSMQSG
jgi:hypothetical protein